MNLKAFTRLTPIAAILMVGIFVSGCSNYHNVPPGYIGKVLTPTGWKTGIEEAGQVDLGAKDGNGSYNRLVLLEATSITIKEQFLGKESSLDKEDHRVLTGNQVPLAVDVYQRVGLPVKMGELDMEKIDYIFSTVTPQQMPGADDRTLVVTLADIYDRFAKQDIRSATRTIFASYEDDRAIYKNYGNVDDQIGSMVIKTYNENGVPLDLQSASLGNVKVDDEIWRARTKAAAAVAAAEAIEGVGKMLEKYPAYNDYMGWQTVDGGLNKGNGMIVVVGGSGNGDMAKMITAARAAQARTSEK